MVIDATLAVYHAQTLVGWLFNTHPLRFEYDPAWREHSEAVSLSPSLPLSQPVHEGDSTNRTTRLTEEHVSPDTNTSLGYTSATAWRVRFSHHFFTHPLPNL